MEFKYVAQDRLGKKTRNTITARDIPSAVLTLKTEGLLPLKIKEIFPAQNRLLTIFLFQSKKVKSLEVALFTRQLAATLAAGLLLSEALETIGQQLENDYFSKVIKDIRNKIHGGLDFSSALSQYPRIFSVSYIAIIKSGEATGTLSATMNNLAKFLESSERLKEKIMNAVTYPLFIFGFALLVVILLVLFLVPKFQEIYGQLGAQLPLLTQIVVSISQFIIHHALLFFLGNLTFIALLIRLGRYKEIKNIYDILLLKTPVIGKLIIHKFILSRFCHTLSVLLGNGVGVSNSMIITAQVVDHYQFARAIERIRIRVVGGCILSQELKSYKIFPPLVSKMALVGERTGKIAEMLKRTANYFDDELDNTIHRLTALIEPALIIVIGGFISIIVVALYLPIFGVVRLVQ